MKMFKYACGANCILKFSRNLLLHIPHYLQSSIIDLTEKYKHDLHDQMAFAWNFWADKGQSPQFSSLGEFPFFTKPPIYNK